MFCTGKDGTLYSKLFASLLTSSVWDTDIETRVVWITLLALKDQDGFARVATVEGLARLARVSVEGAEKAVKILTSDDPESSDPEHAGRRIERAPGGWVVLNAKKYDALGSEQHRREKNAEYVRKHRERKREEAECKGSVSTCKQVKAYTDTDTDTDTDVQSTDMAPSPPKKHAPDASAPQVRALFAHYRQHIQPAARICPADKIKARLKTFSPEEIREAITRFAADTWQMQHNATRGAPWFFHSDARIEGYLHLQPRRNEKDNDKRRNGQYQPESATTTRATTFAGLGSVSSNS